MLQEYMQQDTNKILAVSVFAICYVVLFSEKVNRAIVAILGAGIMIFTGVLSQTSALDVLPYQLRFLAYHLFRENMGTYPSP